MKICFAASSGGHLEEIACLRPIEQEYDSFLVTEKGGFNEHSFGKNVYHVQQVNRKEPLFIIYLVKIFFKSLSILLKEKPDCIISTGALATFPICLLGKILRKKIIYIESFARVDEASMTGKFMYRIADLFIVQWAELLKIYPKATHTGGVF
ncbi:PssD/Cps14F family polysaccharide biosynthesis glycosyltransferase [Desulfosporosinus sp. OT]|uniref:PssD/Cps14F family polysaccharide biosynthesis glycosyltransferase n=1 Tax=Desulfosporosinus sp. OT TaxID=913865 RepID=UPI000223A6D4|nr:PssD/Cps14F family polysaccharide biosynthesis glycosyltransferase [Desulfosporosinus sp. OT]EGW41276.1 oligosaccharide biosynthesis Alg14 like family protein [Desulfosporosinus sp. OT]